MKPTAPEVVFRYLNQRSSTPPEHCDAIIGFGHFDQRIARQCGELWRAGVAPRIIFTGGVGAGSADLGQPEARAFAATLHDMLPEFPADALLLETESTNTGENIRYLSLKAKTLQWPLTSVVLVASPYRMRRVALTWREQGPGAGSRYFCVPPLTTWDEEYRLFAAKGENLIRHLPGEIDRLTTYATRGWIAHTAVPLEVAAAADSLR
ncbi:YdcF family protein [Actomonas aquatica]|uniref:YdcF family protein n=1 Tax=Actomonas aquatica TaxID=2866162 RepID=A0ABZ1C7J6_9BACT|nr:YdcF family protein [Opitutus sp. WL0086]WRQ87559.1 YdcF family protein [Opitutus sp. WL0086]